ILTSDNETDSEDDSLAKPKSPAKKKISQLKKELSSSNEAEVQPEPNLAHTKLRKFNLSCFRQFIHPEETNTPLMYHLKCSSTMAALAAIPNCSDDVSNEHFFDPNPGMPTLNTLSCLT